MPQRGEIWWYDPDSVRGREQDRRRPVLVISSNAFNSGPRGLIIVLPLTRSDRGYSLHVRIESEESGLGSAGFIMCEQIRAISPERLLDRRPVGRVSMPTMEHVEYILESLLFLP